MSSRTSVVETKGNSIESELVIANYCLYTRSTLKRDGSMSTQDIMIMKRITQCAALTMTALILNVQLL